jgi:hypothetical protein
MTAADILLKQAARLIPRLEKLTPDLRAANRASGLRRTLLRLTRELALDDLTPQTARLLQVTLEKSCNLLGQAARDKMR